VIDHLQAQLVNDNIGVSFFYCNYKERHEQGTTALIGSLVKQLAVRHLDAPSYMDELYDSHSNDKRAPTPPTLTESMQMLIFQIARFTTSYIVIDALDECSEKSYTVLCDQLQRLPQKARVILTSRGIPKMENWI